MISGKTESIFQFVLPFHFAQAAQSTATEPATDEAPAEAKKETEEPVTRKKFSAAKHRVS